MAAIQGEGAVASWRSIFEWLLKDEKKAVATRMVLKGKPKSNHIVVEGLWTEGCELRVAADKHSKNLQSYFKVSLPRNRELYTWLIDHSVILSGEKETLVGCSRDRSRSRRCHTAVGHSA